MKNHYYFVFEGSNCVLGPFRRYRDAQVEAKEYGEENPTIRYCESDSREIAEQENKELNCVLA